MEVQRERKSGAPLGGASGWAARRDVETAVIADGEEVFEMTVAPRVHPAADAAEGAGA